MSVKAAKAPGTPRVSGPTDPLCDRLERLRQDLDLSYRDIANTINEALRGLGRAPLSKSTVSRWFSGRSSPRLHEALLLARVLGVGLEALVDPASAPVGRDSSAGGWSRSPSWESEVSLIARLLGHREAARRLLLVDEIGDGAVRGARAAD